MGIFLLSVIRDSKDSGTMFTVNIHEKVFHSDWLREMQFLGNIVKKRGILAQKKAF